jgi:hypothetical protein
VGVYLIAFGHGFRACDKDLASRTFLPWFLARIKSQVTRDQSQKLPSIPKNT